jgi:hypothetical protein
MKANSKAIHLKRGARFALAILSAMTTVAIEHKLMTIRLKKTDIHHEFALRRKRQIAFFMITAR